MAPVQSFKTGLISGSLLAGNAVYVPPVAPTAVDYLVVAGGGGAGGMSGANPGGGGAGALKTAAAFSIGASFTVTVVAIDTSSSNKVNVPEVPAVLVTTIFVTTAVVEAGTV